VSVAGFRFVDLFAGIGGFHHALRSIGGECVAAVEKDQRCQAVYSAAFPDFPRDHLFGDITCITRSGPGEASFRNIRGVIPEHDVLCAGFPCQPFSKSGSQLGIRDRIRGTLFHEIMMVVRARQPRYLILENVRNLAGPRHRDTWLTIVEAVRAAGYRTSDEPVVFSPHLLAPAEGGAPQIRDRAFILAERVDAGSWQDRIGSPLVKRAPTPGWDPGRWQIAEWLDSEDDVADSERYRLRPEELSWIEAWQSFCELIPSELPGFPIWADEFRDRALVPTGCPTWKRDFLLKNAALYRNNRRALDRWRGRRWGPLHQMITEFPRSRRKFEWQAREAQPLREQRDLSGLVLHLRPSGIRVKPPTYLPALVAITQTSVVGPRVSGGGWRRITPREAAKLQGIPPDVFDAAGVDDATAYRQLGNAVNTGVVKYLAKVLFNGIDTDLRLEFARAV
jgi:DNA (cytosine-5)-methyltransferase 1